jgi:hypothetical protein
MASTIATSSKIGVASNWGAIADVSIPGAGDPGYVLVLGDDAKLHVYKSTDGTTWTEQDSADAPTVHDATYPYSGHRAGSFIYTIRFTAANTVRVRRFDCSSDQWETTDTPASDAYTSANNTRSVRVVEHSDGDIVVLVKDSGNADVAYRVWNGGSWGSATTVTGADGNPLDMPLMVNGHVLMYIQDTAGDDATYRTLSSGSAQGTATDFDVSVNTGELKSSRVTLFNDGTNDRIFAVNCDTGNEVDGYVATEGTPALGAQTTINAISTATNINLTSLGTAVYNSKLWVCWANDIHDVFYDSSTSLTTLTFGTDQAGNAYAAAPMPQFITMGDGLGILAQNGTSVEVEWITAPTAGGSVEADFSAAGTSTAAFAASVAKPVAFTAAGVSSEQIAASVAKPVAFAAAGQATAAFDALIVKSAEVASAGASTAAYAASVAKPVAVTAVAASTATLAASVAKPVAVAATGASTAAFGATVTRSVALAVAATSTAAYAAAVAKPVAFAAAGVSTASFEAASEGVVTAAFVAAGQSAATFAASVTKPVAVAAAGQSAASLAASVSRSASLTVAATSGTTITAAVDAVGALSVAAQSSAVFDAFIGAVLDAFAFDMAVTTTSLDIAITTAQHIIVIEAADLELAVRAGG